MNAIIVIQDVLQDSGISWKDENEQYVISDFYCSLVTFGKCVYWVNGKKNVLEKGNIILIPSRIPFYWKSIPSVFHSKYVVTFKLNIGVPSLPILASDQCVQTKVGSYELILERMKLLSSQWTEKISYYEFYCSALLIEILTLLNRQLDRGTIVSEKHRFSELMKIYIQEHYRNKITKDDLATVIHKSPNHTATLFSTITGQTISEYVHALRTKTAIYMLCESLLNVGEISEYLGYSDVSYFNKTFKKITGNPPSYYLSERPSRII